MLDVQVDTVQEFMVRLAMSRKPIPRMLGAVSLRGEIVAYPLAGFREPPMFPIRVHVETGEVAWAQEAADGWWELVS